MKETHYAIVGAGPAGVAAAEAIRQVDSKGAILLFNGEAQPPYCRPLVVEALTGERQLSEIGLKDAAWYESLGIELVNGEKVTAIDHTASSLELASGETVAYKKLLLATGSQPAMPPIPGLTDVPAHTLFCTDDAEALRPLCKEGGRALVLGIGLIGMQAISALTEMGLQVTAVEMQPKVLPLILDADAANLVAQRIEANGVTLKLSTAIVECGPEGDAFVAVTDGGERIVFDVAVVATGMRPDFGLLSDLGVEKGRGIKVSETMETSLPGIYAAGDVTEYPNWVEGSSEVHAHWLNATRQGRIAGRAMAGAEGEHYEPLFLNSINVFGLPLITVGASRMDDTGEATVFAETIEERPRYRRLVIREGKLVAATFVNDVDGAGALQYLIRNKVELSDAVAASLFADGAAGVAFLDELHRKSVQGGLEWPESMDLIDKFKKNMKHTRWA
jgi:NAD(P)H-nitrite reductase large subunit